MSSATMTQVVRFASGIAKPELDTIHRLSQIAAYRDNETFYHMVRVGHYARLLGSAIGVSEHRQNLLLYAAPMHDIGKIAVPESILLKPGRLTEDEWAIMMTHARIGYEILRDSDSE